MNGVLIVNKPAGWTSHDVVAKTRGILGEKRIGHLGTLDPLATGVLPLAVGAATRLIEFASFDKEYVATCLLGKTTDSCDVTGKVLEERPWEGLEEGKVREEVLKLKTLTEQVPPMVSAVKSGGRKLYELARKGIEVERKARPIRIVELEVLGVDLPKVTFRVSCSPGTYVRSLCQTLGEALGTGGCMEGLARTRVGPFRLEEALTLEAVQKGMEGPGLPGVLVPAASLVRHLPRVPLEGGELEALCQGKTLARVQGEPGPVMVLDREGRLCAVGDLGPDGLLRPKKVFGLGGIL